MITGTSTRQRMSLRHGPGRVAAPCMVLLAAAGILLVAAGCATTGTRDDYDSDLPWNTPASWEGSPSIPGFDNR